MRCLLQRDVIVNKTPCRFAAVPLERGTFADTCPNAPVLWRTLKTIRTMQNECPPFKGDSREAAGGLKQHLATAVPSSYDDFAMRGRVLVLLLLLAALPTMGYGQSTLNF